MVAPWWMDVTIRPTRYGARAPRFRAASHRAERGGMELPCPAACTTFVQLVRDDSAAQTVAGRAAVSSFLDAAVQSVEFARIPPWEQMCARVAAQLGQSPLLKDVADAPSLEASRFGVRMRLGTDAVAVMRFQWYLPLTDERAVRLASDLALQARGARDEAAA